MTPLRWLALAVVVLLGATFGYWFMQNFEQVTEESYVGYSGEARYNPYLAAQRFMERTGRTADSLSSLRRLGGTPEVDDVLFFFGTRRTLVDSDINRLHGWVVNGGHLVLEPLSFDDEPDALLEALTDLEVRVLDDTASEPVEITLAGETLKVDPSPVVRLVPGETPPDLELADEHGNLLLHYYLGDGAVTVLANPWILHNDTVGEHDHAALLARLVELNGNEGAVWFVYGDDMPPLWRWLWDKAPAVVITAAVVLALWLWTGTRRFGPKLPSPPAARRRLREHVLACGRFLWRQGQPQTLLLTAKKALHESIVRQHPGWAQRPVDELYRHLAEHCDLDEGAVRQALGDEPLNHPTDFIRRMQYMDQIRERL